MGEPIDTDRRSRPIKRQCTGHRKDGGRCLRSANRGTTVCNSHGGAARQVRQAAERRRHRERAESACAVLGLPIDTAPEDALQNELAWCNGHVQWLRGQVAELTVADLMCNTGAALVGLYGAERDRLVTIARVMIAADVHGRMQETARQLAAWLTAVLDGALDSSRLAFDQAEAVRAELPGKIRTIPFPHLGVIDGSDGLDGDGDGAA